MNKLIFKFLPPSWKIKREFISVYDGFIAFFLYIFSPLWMPIYNKKEMTSLQIYEGLKKYNSNLVIYLIHQPRGLIESNIIAIQFLVSKGYDVFVVSNGRLSNADIEKLQNICWKIIIRKNIGYDFGGYRCGLRFLRQEKILLNNLALINDSIWFPIIDDKTLLFDSSHKITDFGGAVCLKNLNAKLEYLILSYWIILQRHILNSDKFWTFWDKYIPTSNKTLTVKLGERGLSSHMIKSGFKADGIFTNESFMFAIKSASNNELRLTLKYGSYTDLLFENESLHLLNTFENSDHWRNLCFDFIQNVVNRRGFLHSFCYASISILNVPFLKKNNLELQKRMRQQYINAVLANDLPKPPLPIWLEILKTSKRNNRRTI